MEKGRKEKVGKLPSSQFRFLSEWVSEYAVRSANDRHRKQPAEKLEHISSTKYN